MVFRNEEKTGTSCLILRGWPQPSQIEERQREDKGCSASEIVKLAKATPKRKEMIKDSIISISIY
jgi:hypothetical protein